MTCRIVASMGFMQILTPQSAASAAIQIQQTGYVSAACICPGMVNLRPLQPEVSVLG